MSRYVSAERRTCDDFGTPFTMQEGEHVYDAKVPGGPWGTLAEENFRLMGCTLGTGRGQKYRRTADGELVKVEG